MAKYVFKPYSSRFPFLFVQEKNRILTYLDKDALVDHIGSTAVPGLGGKGIINISIAVEKDKIAKVSKELIKAGYEYHPHDGDADRLFFQKDINDEVLGEQRCHLHLTSKASNCWKEKISFRNYLIRHPDEMQKYAMIKQKAVEEANEDRDKYMAIKEPVIKEMTVKAIKEFDAVYPA